MSIDRTVILSWFFALAAATFASADHPASADLPPPAPHPRPKPTEQACFSPSDCRGMLPQVCRRCAGGGLGCAHWECERGRCRVAFCERGGDEEAEE